MTQVTYDFIEFPWFNGERRPVYIKGRALCELTKVTESKSLGDPVRVDWSVKRVEAQIGSAKKPMIDFNGSTPDMEDFTRWLHGRHGIKIANQLRDAHQRDAQTTEDA